MTAHNFIDLTGHAFGRLTVINRADNAGGRPLWNCKCACGAVVAVYGHYLRSGETRSCKCLLRDRYAKAKAEMRTHGLAKSTEHRIWSNIKSRCLNPRATFYARYGGRGIAICERWKSSFAAFYADMGPRPSPGHSIDRINNDGPYSPENCRWATGTQQARNASFNRNITIHGVTKPLIEWAELSGVKRTTLRQRLRYGWSPERAVEQPVRALTYTPNS